MTKVKCPGCGKEIDDKIEKCPECGYSISAQEIEKKESDGEEILEAMDHNVECDNNETQIGNKIKYKRISMAIGTIVLLCIIIGVVVISKRNAEIREQQEAEVQEIEEYNTYMR